MKSIIFFLNIYLYGDKCEWAFCRKCSDYIVYISSLGGTATKSGACLLLFSFIREWDKIILLFQASRGDCNINITFSRTLFIGIIIHITLQHECNANNIYRRLKKNKIIKKRIRCTPSFIVQNALSFEAITAAAVANSNHQKIL